MAASLRHPLSALIWLAMAAVYLPLVPAAAMLLTPALSAGNWQRLFDDPQIPQALAATLVSTLIATLGALFIALIFVTTLWPGERWRRLCTRLPWLLAVPHVAFATSVLLTFAEGGLFYQLCTRCSPMLDRYGIGLGFRFNMDDSHNRERSAGYGAFHLGGRYFLSDGNTSAFVGGGLAYTNMDVTRDEPERYESLEGSGLSAYGEVGVELLRLHSSRLAFDLRFETPFYMLKNDTYPSVQYDPATDSYVTQTPTEESSYVVPIMAGLAYTF